ncbi:eukaryotic translation initiation factor 4 gamma [Musa troglodytarum]|uniref:Eukaryotic translation initiation factor 4 gamma n=1 Tax=Musa troglodytarum TaxID=320322 RepID=A0A9E7FSQ7_9LILI|nr:eukaryotic translation initiation factor 4 gamma [Musa troglodytarum]
MQSDRMVISFRPGGGAGNCPPGSTPHPLAAAPQSAPSPFSPSFAPPATPSLLSLTEKERVLKTVKGILNKLTPEKFDVLKGQLIDDVITLIFEKAVFKPTFCPMYAQLCSDLNENIPLFPSEDEGGKEITFKCILLNNCHEAF